MRFRRPLVAVSLGAAIATAALAALAFAATTSVTCTGTQSTNVTGDLNVPAGKTCTISPGVKIGNDVNVNAGSTLIDNGAIVGHDINGTNAKGIGIGGSASGPGRVGEDIDIYATSGAGPGTVTRGDNYICDTAVVNDVNVQNSTSAAGQWIIGDTDEECTRGGNQIGHDINVQSNKNRVDISDNEKGTAPYSVGITHDLTVGQNTVTSTSPIVESNYIGHDADCQAGTKKDGDGSKNIVGHDNNGCP